MLRKEDIVIKIDTKLVKQRKITNDFEIVHLFRIGFDKGAIL